MIDMHSHILFGVDDGPKTIEDTIRIVEKAAKQGIKDMIATPHAFSPHYHVPKEEIEGQIRLLTDCLQAGGYPINLHTGQEVRLHEQVLEKIIKNEAMTLAGSRYLLLELPSQSIPLYTVSAIQSMLENGVIPIIAHPERNRAIAEKPARLEQLIRHGAFAQVNAGSLSGHFGKSVQRLSIQLVEANLIHTYGSDVHDTKTRPLLFREGLGFLEKKKKNDSIDILLENNKRILTDEPFIILDPEMPVTKKWWKPMN
ncbi:capsular biosynthesis protein [Sporosarcina sp. ACRSL]|uniref:tyrosine-protein phosphatase n=1 Tax=Sporosarcina sp. ACRSL TaxID=2918215 RepID=UPI001EF42202|nr:CpsB/CapC family capsule biosynthesis tyrosine phosphatase [Sporosarcina sp. ACRSL]MCG7345459.1 capsular biosynthesis protein [Sporosarcina sp. ACRSL]